MSDDRKTLVERYARPAATGAVNATEIPDSDDYQASAPVSANRPPEPMLEFRFKPGNVLALSYPLLISAALNPSTGIVLEFTSHRVTLRGRNLRSVFQAIRTHRVPYVQELPGSLDGLPDDAVVISEIQVQSL